jgi:hypothetical protein
MPTYYLPVKFVQRCQKYLELNPEVADDVADFVERCGRLGLKYLEKILKGEDKQGKQNSKEGRDKPWPLRDILLIEEDSNTVPGDPKPTVYVSDKDYRKVEELVVQKLGLTTTAISWYILCVFMVTMGYWKLPPKV